MRDILWIDTVSIAKVFMPPSSRLAGLLLLCGSPRVSPGALSTAASSCRRRRIVMCARAPVNSFATAFMLPLQHGWCVAVRLPEEGTKYPEAAPEDELHPLESERMHDMAPARRLYYAGGRVAMRRALRHVGASAAASAPILSETTGAPAVLEGAHGSISHTRGLAAALVRPPHQGSSDGALAEAMALGVDVERSDRVVSLTVARRVLSDDERRTLGAREAFPAPSDLLLRICLKEALYKALHPIARRPIRWHSVSVQPAADGSCAVEVGELAAELGRPLRAHAAWVERDGFFVTTAAAAWSGPGGAGVDVDEERVARTTAAEDATPGDQRGVVVPLDVTQ